RALTISAEKLLQKPSARLTRIFRSGRLAVIQNQTAVTPSTYERYQIRLPQLPATHSMRTRLFRNGNSLPDMPDQNDRPDSRRRPGACDGGCAGIADVCWCR